MRLAMGNHQLIAASHGNTLLAKLDRPLYVYKYVCPSTRSLQSLTHATALLLSATKQAFICITIIGYCQKNLTALKSTFLKSRILDL